MFNNLKIEIYESNQTGTCSIKQVYQISQVCFSLLENLNFKNKL